MGTNGAMPIVTEGLERELISPPEPGTPFLAMCGRTTDSASSISCSSAVCLFLCFV